MLPGASVSPARSGLLSTSARERRSPTQDRSQSYPLYPQAGKRQGTASCRFVSDSLLARCFSVSTPETWGFKNKRGANYMAVHAALPPYNVAYNLFLRSDAPALMCAVPQDR